MAINVPAAVATGLPVLSPNSTSKVGPQSKPTIFGFARHKPSSTGLTRVAIGIAAAALVTIGIAIAMNNQESKPIADKSTDPPVVPTKNPPVASVKPSWHGWPIDAPPPAIAPFDAAQAKSHQKAWAEYLGVPVDYENSIGMKFRLIPPGEFMMGSTKEEIEEALPYYAETSLREAIKSEAPLHRVILTKPAYLGIHEVTQAQYERIMGHNPASYSATGSNPENSSRVAGMDTTSHPVEMVSWINAAEFCGKLSEHEKLKPFYLLPDVRTSRQQGIGYRLPTEAEWEFACRAGTTTKCWLGNEKSAMLKTDWIKDNADVRTHAVGGLAANPFGLYDLLGNVRELMQDRYGPNSYQELESQQAVDPEGISEGYLYVYRGGSIQEWASICSTSRRGYAKYRDKINILGFRVTLTVEAVKSELAAGTSIASGTSWHGWPADAPPPAIAPFNAEQAKAHQVAWAEYLKVPVEYENSIGMKFRLIPPGEFEMGSTAEQVEAAVKLSGGDALFEKFVRSEAPRHHVVLSYPFYLGIHEVTQRQYQQATKINPAHHQASGLGKQAVAEANTSELPVEMVSWNDSTRFCTLLSESERLRPSYSFKEDTVEFISGDGYRLPTEAEWECSCRAGTITLFAFGDLEEDLLKGGHVGDAKSPKRVGELAGNAFGLFDMHGNVMERVQDAWGDTYYAMSPLLNPQGSDVESARVMRGGAWAGPIVNSRSAQRNANGPMDKSPYAGFRVALSVEAVKELRFREKP